MTNKKYILLFLFLFLSGAVLSIIGQTPPPYKQRRYRSECWMGEYRCGNYLSDIKPDTGLFAIASPLYNEPMNGYPMHSGIVKGVSDTIVLVVEIFNRNEDPYNISSYQPDNWFVPVLYETGADPRKDFPIADTSNFGYSFEYWNDWHLHIVTQPSVIPYSGNEYSLKYYIWGLPYTGRYRLMMKKTDQAPPGFRLLMRQIPEVWITKPVSVIDTINAYAGCFWRARYSGNNNATLAWTDSILALNPSSIVGYKLRTSAYAGLRDSLAMITTFDSTLAILERYGDPLVTDTSEWTFWEKIWYEDMYNSSKLARYRHITGDRRVYQ
ncbi:MAG: hypothetical protein P9X24_18225 [Candidatus Hatepunaea meridiana]|nr:hypothetical protein [Candidatus Hatepunaea meridiana]